MDDCQANEQTLQTTDTKHETIPIAQEAQWWCNISTSKEDNSLECSTCRNLVHFKYTKLPAYSLYSLKTSEEGNYVCESCTQAPEIFLKEHDRDGDVLNNKVDVQMKLLADIQTSVNKMSENTQNYGVTSQKLTTKNEHDGVEELSHNVENFFVTLTEQMDLWKNEIGSNMERIFSSVHNSTIARAQRELSAKECKISLLQSKLVDKMESISALSESNEALNDEIRNKCNLISTLGNKLHNLESIIGNHGAPYESASGRIKSLELQVHNLQTQNNILSVNAGEKDRKLYHLQGELCKFNEKIGMLYAEKAKLEETVTILQSHFSRDPTQSNARTSRVEVIDESHDGTTKEDDPRDTVQDESITTQFKGHSAKVENPCDIHQNETIAQSNEPSDTYHEDVITPSNNHVAKVEKSRHDKHQDDVIIESNSHVTKVEELCDIHEGGVITQYNDDIAKLESPRDDIHQDNVITQCNGHTTKGEELRDTRQDDVIAQSNDHTTKVEEPRNIQEDNAFVQSNGHIMKVEEPWDIHYDDAIAESNDHSAKIEQSRDIQQDDAISQSNDYDTKVEKPRCVNQVDVIIFHDSIFRTITDEELMKEEQLNVRKIWAPRLAKAYSTLSSLNVKPRAILLHTAANDLLHINEDVIVEEILKIRDLAENRGIKFIWSCIVPRTDDPRLNTKAQVVNALVVSKLAFKRDVTVIRNDDYNNDIFDSDGINVTDGATRWLAQNAKIGICKSLGIAYAHLIKNKVELSNHH